MEITLKTSKHIYIYLNTISSIREQKIQTVMEKSECFDIFK